MESLLFEIEIIARPYSPYRCAAKWRKIRQPCQFQSNLISSDSINVLIFREHLKLLDYYPIASIAKRVEIKRSPAYFQCANQLWQQVNPSGMRTISKEIVQIIVEVLYKFNPQSLGNPGLVGVNLKIDCGIDFVDKIGMTFAEFFDVLYECVDNLARSCLVTEYCRVVQNAMKAIQQSPIFCSINLYSKRHLKEPLRVSYHPWMQNLLRSLTPCSTTKHLPELIKKIIHPDAKKPRKSTKTVEIHFLSKYPTFSDIHRHSKSPIQPMVPTLTKAASSKFNDPFELKGLKASLTPVKSLYLD